MANYRLYSLLSAGLSFLGVPGGAIDFGKSVKPYLSQPGRANYAPISLIGISGFSDLPKALALY